MTDKENDTVYFEDLSTWLQILVVYGFIMFSLTAVGFLMGFLEGFFGY